MTAGRSPESRPGRRGVRQLLLLGGCCLLLAAAFILVSSQWDHIAYALGLTEQADPYIAGSAATTRGGTPAVRYRLVIPRLGLDLKIRGGKAATALRDGVWHQCNGASPRTRGNTVLSGHRVAGVFVLLDKLRPGDHVIVCWGRKRYRYKVWEVYETGPRDWDVTRYGRKRQLTLYTCVSRSEGDRRVVVVAKPN